MQRMSINNIRVMLSTKMVDFVGLGDNETIKLTEFS